MTESTLKQQPVEPAADRAADLDLPSVSRQRWAKAARAGRFELQRCVECEAVQYPPREVCRKCLSPSLQWEEQSRRGSLSAATAIRRPYEPRFLTGLPIRIGLVALDAGPVIVAFLDDDCVPDAPVTLRIEIDETGEPVFRAGKG